ncbi:MoxR family ATPase [Dactylosporangium sp. NPDC049140]|uniref:AAA family ATPase n=1 Tax=Dactylosporangium sp. NPDC049140 TaxID=3155647 RepID=UPI0033DB7AE2
MHVHEFMTTFQRLAGSIGQQTGDQEAARNALVCLIAGGHLLLQGGEEESRHLARTLARAVDGARDDEIRFGPDAKDLHLNEPGGPLFTNVLHVSGFPLARPEAQWQLLTAMERRAVELDSVETPLPSPFVSITALPRGHVQRLGLSRRMLDRWTLHCGIRPRVPPAPPEVFVRPTITPADLARMGEVAGAVEVPDAVRWHIVDIGVATRALPSVLVGTSGRGLVALAAAARVVAAADGRDVVSVQDVDAVARPALAHRLHMSDPQPRDADLAVDEIVAALRPVG